MPARRFWLVSAFALLAFAGSGEEARAEALRPGVEVARELTAGAAHSYPLTLDAGQYLEVSVVQEGVDVAVVLLGPDGHPVAEIDVAKRPAGTEELRLLTTAAGSYRIEVRGKDDGAEGSYRVTLQALRPEEPADAIFIPAKRAYAEAQELTAPDVLRDTIELLEETLPEWRRLQDPYAEAWTLNAVGRCYRLLEEMPRAIEYYDQALPLWHDAGDRDSRADTLNNLGYAHKFLGQLDEAKARYEQALDLFREVGNVREEATVLNNLGTLHRRLGRLEEAVEYFDQSLALKDPKDAVGRARTLINLGTASTHLGRMPEALGYLHEALPLLGDGSDRRALAAVLANLGVAYDWLGEPTKALDHYRRSLEINREIHQRSGQAAVLRNVGYVYRSLGELELAAANLTEALELARELGRSGDETNILLNLGYVRHLAGDFEEALEDYEVARALARETQDPVSEVLAWARIGEAYAELGEVSRARDAFEEALRLSSDVDERRWNTLALIGLGEIHAAAREPQPAGDYYGRALELSRTLGDRLTEAGALAGLAQAQRLAGDPARAQEHLAQALDVVETVRANAGSQEMRVSFLATKKEYYDLAVDLAMERHRQDPAAGHDAAALAANERSRARGLLDLLAEMNVDVRQGVQAELLERERSLSRRLNARERYRQSLKDPAARLAVEEEIGGLVAEHREVRGRIRQLSPRYAALTQPRPLSLERIQREVLDPDTLLLAYALGDERSFLWAVTPASIHTFELPPRAAIEDAVRRLLDESLTLPARRPRTATPEERQAWQERLDRATEEYPRRAGELSRTLLGPAADLLPGKRLAVVSDAVLHYLPFAALPAPGEPAGEWVPLVVEHEVVQLPSASVLAAVRRELGGRQPAPRSIAVLADPVFGGADPRVRAARTAASRPRSQPTDEGLSPAAQATRSALLDELDRLRWSGREADEIVRLAPAGDAFKALGFAARRDAVTGPELGRYRFVHFATHAIVHSAYPELSGIVLSLVDEGGSPQPGFLRLHDIYNLDLNADLVVLSACQTALGKELAGEGLMGLARGFLYAGAPRVAASLWAVDDRATAELMKRFYQEALREGRPPAAALRAAQVSMWRQPAVEKWRHPYYWAAFVLYGEWR